MPATRSAIGNSRIVSEAETSPFAVPNSARVPISRSGQSLARPSASVPTR